MARAQLIIVAILAGLSVPPILTAHRAVEGLEQQFLEEAPLRWLTHIFLLTAPAWPLVAGAVILACLVLTCVKVNPTTRSMIAFIITCILFCVMALCFLAFAMPIEESLSKLSE